MQALKRLIQKRKQDRRLPRRTPNTSIRKQTRMWTCRDGTRIRLCDMDDVHLENAIKMCIRNAESKRLRDAANMWALDTLFGDNEHFQDSLSHFIDADLRDYLPDICEPYMFDEARRRGLDIGRNYPEYMEQVRRKGLGVELKMVETCVGLQQDGQHSSGDQDISDAEMRERHRSAEEGYPRW